MYINELHNSFHENLHTFELCPNNYLLIVDTHTKLLFNNNIFIYLGWDQSDKYIKVFVTLKNAQSVPKEQVYCKLTERSMELHVDNLENKDYLLVINKLLEPINVEDSHWKQKTG